jgi:hypothetical protein
MEISEAVARNECLATCQKPWIEPVKTLSIAFAATTMKESTLMVALRLQDPEAPTDACNETIAP